MATKYAKEDLSELPTLDQLVTVVPKLTLCDVCGHANEVIKGSNYVQYRKLEKDEDGAETWKKDWVYEYGKATLEPSKDHVICDRMRKVDLQVGLVWDEVGRLKDRRRAPFFQRLRQRVAWHLHRLGELVQR